MVLVAALEMSWRKEGGGVWGGWGLSTAVKSRCVRPQYSVNRPQLLSRSVLIAVWHHGRLSRNTFLGEVEVPLDGRDLDCTRLERLDLRAKVSTPQTNPKVTLLSPTGGGGGSWGGARGG